MTSMALSLARLMRKEEKTLKEIRARAAIKPSETAMKIGYRKKLVSGLGMLAVR